MMRCSAQALVLIVGLSACSPKNTVDESKAPPPRPDSGIAPVAKDAAPDATTDSGAKPDAATDSGAPTTVPDATADSGAPTNVADATTGGSGMSSAPQWFGTFSDAVGAASRSGLGGTGPQVCSVAIPPRRVQSRAEADRAVTSYVSGIVGGPALDADPIACGGAQSAPCASRYQFYSASFGGATSTKTYVFAQQIDQAANLVTLVQYDSPNDAGAREHALVISGIRDGWLMAMATFVGRTSCE